MILSAKSYLLQNFGTIENAKSYKNKIIKNP